jgi:hypothetical protein
MSTRSNGRPATLGLLRQLLDQLLVRVTVAPVNSQQDLSDLADRSPAWADPRRSCRAQPTQDRAASRAPRLMQPRSPFAGSFPSGSVRPIFSCSLRFDRSSAGAHRKGKFEQRSAGGHASWRLNRLVWPCRERYGRLSVQEEFAFDTVFVSKGIKIIKTPVRSPKQTRSRSASLVPSAPSASTGY